MSRRKKFSPPEDREGAHFGKFLKNQRRSHLTQHLHDIDRNDSGSKQTDHPNNVENDPILIEYAALIKSGNIKRARTFYSLHQKHLDTVIHQIQEKLAQLDAGDSKKCQKTALRIRKKFARVLKDIE